MTRLETGASDTELEAGARPTDTVAGSNEEKQPPARSLRGLDWLNFLLADVQSGVGPFLAIVSCRLWLERTARRSGADDWRNRRHRVANTSRRFGGSAQVEKGADCGRSVALAIGALLIAFFPSFWVVVTAQTLIGAMSSFFMPAIAAISLGLVGHRLFNRRQGRNQTFNSAGNVAAAVMMGLIGFFISNRGVFFFVVMLALPTILSLLLIAPDEIDYELARGARTGEDDERPASVRYLLKDRTLAIFLCCAVLFHFANAAMLPLLGEMLAKGKGRSSMMFMSACVITTQFTITLIAAWAAAPPALG